MIIGEPYGDGLVRHHSDRGVMMLQVETGITYADAIDVVPCPYTYEETDERIDPAETQGTMDFLVESMQSVQSDVSDLSDGVAELSEVVSEQADEVSGHGDAIAELSGVVSEQGEEMAGQGDAIAELSEIVSGLVPTE